MLFFEDFYYTAGQDFVYRRLMTQNSKLYRFFKPPQAGDSSKVIVQYRLGVKVFTPIDIEQTVPKYIDRPYAGWDYANITLSNFPSPHISNQYQFEIGLTGPSSGGEELQKYIHKITSYDRPKGWRYQIQNEVVVNAYYSRYYNWRLGQDADLVSQSAVQAGTGSNMISQDFTFRLVEFNDLENSVFTNSRLSWDDRRRGKERKKEFFLFAGTGVRYVLTNIFMEGSLFPGNPSPLTAPVEPWVIQTKYGMMFSQHNISWSLTLFHVSKEIQAGTPHDYASASLAVRF